MEEQKLEVILILEILGKPPQYLIESLSKLIESISKENGVSLINKKIAEPKEIDKEHNIFSSFAEIELSVKDVTTLIILIFNYMPSHVELISPSSIEIKNYDLNNFFNELTRRLHQYDEIAKISILEKNILINQLKQIQKNIQSQRNNTEINKDEEKKEIKNNISKENKKKLGKK
ncbi:MAG: hypothetical protein QW117_01755 [Candidatus Pacearchaeota archaeon]